MKVGMFAETYFPQTNGVVAYVSDVSEQLIKTGNRVEVYVPEIKGYKDKQDFVHRLPGIKGVTKFDSNQRLVIPLPNKEFRSMLTSKFDIIHAHTGGPVSLWGLQIAKTKGIPYVITYHTLFTAYLHYVFNGKIIKPKVIEVLTKVFGNQCDALIAPSEKIKQEILRYGVTRPVFVLPNSVDVERFNGQKKGTLREKFEIKGKILLFVGRLAEEKNVEFLLKSFQIVAAKDKSSTLVIVGKGPDSESLENFANGLGINNRVVFTGAIPMEQMPGVYSEADVFTFPSVSEVHSVAVLEAISSRLPVVTLQDTAYSSTVLDGVNGFQTNHNAKEYAQRILELLKDSDEKENFAKASRELAKSQFSLSAHVSKLSSLYEVVIANHHPSRMSEALSNVAKLRRMARVAFSVNRLLGE